MVEVDYPQSTSPPRELERISRRTWVTFHPTYFPISRALKNKENAFNHVYSRHTRENAKGFQVTAVPKASITMLLKSALDSIGWIKCEKRIHLVNKKKRYALFSRNI